jgi:hypothetical protein
VDRKGRCHKDEVAVENTGSQRGTLEESYSPLMRFIECSKSQVTMLTVSRTLQSVPMGLVATALRMSPIKVAVEEV